LGRNTRGDKEYTRLQKALHENEKLKREISKLRKQLARLDLDRHSYVRDIIDEFYENEDKKEKEKTVSEVLEDLKKAWECKECHAGYLEIFTYSKLGETWYFRRCNNPSCGHRTKSQPYNNSVKGIKHEDTIPKTPTKKDR
jgi:cell division septum initiation protein DivIVA